MLVYRRGPRKVLADYKFDDIYKFYKEVNGAKALPKATVKEIYRRLFPEIVKLIIFENLDFRMPARLGYIRIKKKLTEPKIDEEGNLDTRSLSINWKKTKRFWQKLYPGKSGKELKLIKGKPLIRELNESTDGYRMIWFWDKTTSNVKNQNAYYINMTRDHDRLLTGALRANNLNYYT